MHVVGELRDALVQVRDRLVKSIPTKISKYINETWSIFTDGAYEPGSGCAASVGGVLVSPNGSVLQYLGEVMCDELIAEFTEDSEHPKYEREILPILIATKLRSSLSYLKLSFTLITKLPGPLSYKELDSLHWRNG